MFECKGLQRITKFVGMGREDLLGSLVLHIRNEASNVLGAPFRVGVGCKEDRTIMMTIRVVINAIFDSH